jgi:hypothetical protein
MSFNRLKDDILEQKQYLKETTGPGNYRVKQPLTTGSCFQNNPSIILQKSGVSLHKKYDWRFYSGPVDVESELKNLTRPASKCPTDKYLPKCSNCGYNYQGAPCGAGVSVCTSCRNKKCGDKNLVDFPDCHFPVVHTMLDDCPPRGVGINRFEYPCLNPQQDVVMPPCFRISSRQVMKDNFKPCIRKPAVNSMNP